ELGDLVKGRIGDYLRERPVDVLPPDLDQISSVRADPHAVLRNDLLPRSSLLCLDRHHPLTYECVPHYIHSRRERLGDRWAHSRPNFRCDHLRLVTVVPGDPVLADESLVARQVSIVENPCSHEPSDLAPASS